MSEMKEFDVLKAPLSGVHLVEANAGTGKTWNIEALVIRLLIEKQLEPGQVLVVTFTDAAAQELRERVLERINQVYIALSDSEYSESDVFLEACRNKYGSDNQVLEHLENCKSRFDEASIYTIHSFCKQVLTDFRFESGLETEMQIMPDSRVIQQEVIKDEWRSLNHRFSKSPDSRLADILKGKLSLSQLEASFRTYASSTGVKLDMDAGSLLNQVTERVKSRWTRIDPLKWIRDYIELLNEAIKTWDQHQGEIRRQWMEVKFNHWQHDYTRNGTVWEVSLNEFLNSPLSKVNGKHVEKFTSSFLQNTDLHKNNTAPLPDHPFFELIDFLHYAKDTIQNLILRESCERMKRSYLQKRQQQQVLIYDDLLAFTERALDPDTNGENASVLADALRDKYKVALIDEFQDTDQVQYSIFRRIYVESTRENQLLYMIGDPKQSIYRFRGADLKTYFKARRDAQNTFTLSRNFRSTQALVQGINAVFSGKGSFLDSELIYKESTAHKTTSSIKIGHETDVPLRFIDVIAKSDNIAPRELAVMKWVVSSISRILSGKVAESTIIDKSSGSSRLVHPGDLAILVSTHYQSRRIKNMLAEVGIPAVESGDASVFLSEEAAYLNLLLDVIQNPRRSRKVRALLTTPLLGLTSEQVYMVEQDDIQWSHYTETFRIGEQISSQKGILAGLRFLFDSLGIEKNLVARGNGERSLTNLRHLAELLHSEEESQRRSLSGLASWLLAQRSDADAEKSDERSMRLDSDDERVHIMTMHSSKGLQFPVVYVPFLWIKPWRGKADVFYVEDSNSGEYVRVYDPDNLVHVFGKAQSQIESLQDRIRLLYVTLTRAEERCYVPYSSGKLFHFSPLYAALTTRIVSDGVDFNDLGESIVNSKTDNFSIPDGWNDNNLVGSILADLNQQLPESINYELCDFIDRPVIFEQNNRQNTLKAREFDRNHEKRLFPGRIVSSYSSIQRKYGHESTFDAMQRDEHADQDEATVEPTGMSSDVVLLSRDRQAILSFPKGAITGNYWHELLETIDFKDASIWKEIVEQLSVKYGFNDPVDIETVLKLIHNTVESPIGQHPKFKQVNPEMQTLKLASLQWTQTLREMEFLYPYSATELQDLVSELRKGLEQNEKVSALANISNWNTVNLLTGLIDLVFESNGKFFILDYKSNHLGDSLQNYGHNEIEQDIRLNGYNMQYHLYTAALVKYLSRQINEFSYEKHFGGVFYLYWRGLNPKDTTGVFYDKPSWKIVKALIDNVPTDEDISAKASMNNSDQIRLNGGVS